MKGDRGRPTSYQVVRWNFIQSEPGSEAKKEGLEDNLGSIDGSVDSQWLKEQNEQADEWTEYKLLDLIRHGQGPHNEGRERYGAKDWRAKWSKEYGDGKLTWGPDPRLNKAGVAEARRTRAAWLEYKKAGLPLPKSVYCSTLSRAADTERIVFGDGVLDESVPVRFREAFREPLGWQTPNKRSTKTYLQEMYPEFEMDEGLPEEDELWDKDHRETDEERNARVKLGLDDIFAWDRNDTIAIVSHTGTMKSIHICVGHPPIDIPTGGVVTLLIKASWKPELSESEQEATVERISADTAETDSSPPSDASTP